MSNQSSAAKAVGDWIAWFIWSGGPSPRGTDDLASEAARLIARDCQARGLVVRIVEDPEIAALRELSNGPTIVVSGEQPPPHLITSRMIVIGDGTGRGPVRCLSIPPDATAPDIALRVLESLESAGFVPNTEDEVYSEEEEERLRKALDDLGYL